MADPHIGHEKVAKARGFGSVEQHDAEIMLRIADRVNPRKDTLILLGDIQFGAQSKSRIAGIFAAKTVRCVLGNHDKAHALPDEWRFYGSYEIGGAVFTHIPMHPDALMQRWHINIHGHLHGEVVRRIRTHTPDIRYRCVSLEMTGMNPVQLAGHRLSC